MTAEQMRKALVVTPENAKELTEMFSDLVTPQLSDMYLQAVANYDKEKGEGAFKALRFYDKLSFTFWYALMLGYERALKDVQEAQQMELAAG